MPTISGPPLTVGATQADPLIGQEIAGRFRVLELIGRGGMAKVYRCEQASLGRQVALKVLDPSLAGKAKLEWERRFNLEASACSKLKHPNTVTIFDFGSAPNGVFYIAMELLEGRTLVDVLRHESPLPATRAVHIARQVARSLREAHSSGIVHRDLKPANVFLVAHDDDPDFVKVLDFGLVKEVAAPDETPEADSNLGTPKYMAPEQIRDEPVDARCDVYALGIMLHEMLTGRPLFAGRGTLDILVAHLRDPIPRLADVNPSLDVPDDLEQLVMDCVAKELGHRVASMHDLLTRMRALCAPGGAVPLASDPSLSGPIPDITGPTPRAPLESDLHARPTQEIGGLSDALSFDAIAPGAPPRRRPWLAILALLASIVGLGGVVFASGVFDEPPPPEPVRAPIASPTPASVRLQLRSTPPGAVVHVGERIVCNTTPCELSWPANRERPVTFRFVLSGAPDATVTRTIHGDVDPISATLRPTQRRPRNPRPPARVRPPKKPAKDTALNDYKDNPYD